MTHLAIRTRSILTQPFDCVANFQLPEEGAIFDTVEFVELQRDEAQPLVEQYNKEGKAAQPQRGSGGGFDRDRFSSGGRGRYGNCLYIKIYFTS